MAPTERSSWVAISSMVVRSKPFCSKRRLAAVMSSWYRRSSNDSSPTWAAMSGRTESSQPRGVAAVATAIFLAMTATLYAGPGGLTRISEWVFTDARKGRPQMERNIEERHGFAGALRALGGLGGPSRPPIQSIRGGWGGGGGLAGPPHVT